MGLCEHQEMIEWNFHFGSPERFMMMNGIHL